MQNYVLGCRRFLAEQTDVQAVLGVDSRWDTWLFQHKLYVTVEGSESVACVLSPAGSWTSPNQHNTANFPRLRVEFYADPQRDTAKNVTVDDTWDKLVEAFTAVDKYLHMVDGEAMWDDVRVFSSVRLGELDDFPWQEGDGARRAEVYYALGVG